MLILARRVNESIIINDDISITVLCIKGKQVRIGIDAPADTSVHRDEIYGRVELENTDEYSESDSDQINLVPGSFTLSS